MFETVFIDFDKTIFDCYDFEKKLSNFFLSLGITKEDYEKSYLSSLHSYSKTRYDYSLEEHLKIVLSYGYKLDFKKELKELNKLFSEIKLFDDSEFFLENMKKNMKKNILLSAGEKKFQIKKIKAVKIKKYFDKIKIVDGEKEKYLQKIIKKDKQYLFINDNLRENILIKNFFTNVVVISKADFKKYSLEDYKKSQIPFFNSLTEIFEYVQEKYQ